MSLLKSTSLRVRLAVTVTALTASTLLLTLGLKYIYDMDIYRDSTAQNLAGLARVVAENSTAALSFDSREDATTLLSSLRENPTILGGVIFRRLPSGRYERFANYVRADHHFTFPAVPEPDGHTYEKQRLVLYQTIRQDDSDTQLGVLMIASDLSALRQRQRSYICEFGLGLLLTALLGTVIVVYLNRTVSSPLQQLSETASQVAAGSLDVGLPLVRRADEVGNLTAAFHAMIVSLQAVESQALEVARGRYETVIEPKSDRDRLGMAMQDMTESLRLMDLEAKRQEWLQSGETQLYVAMRGDLDEAEFCEAVIAFLCSYLDCPVGVLYLWHDQRLRAMATHAVTLAKLPAREFEAGEGLVGLAARSGRRQILEDPPADYLTVKSGLGQCRPQAVILQPLMFNDQVVGVLELAVVRAYHDQVLEFLDSVSGSIGIGIMTTQNRRTALELLHRTRDQAEELQAQQEELRAANEELEEKTRALEDQSKALVEKNDELERNRADLQVQADRLEKADRYKSDFLANMSHELRTPLNSILLLAQMLRDDTALSDDDRQSAAIIHGSGTDLLNLINEILDLSKIEAGAMEMTAEEVSPAMLADVLRTKFGPLAASKNLDFQVTVDASAPARLITDGMRLEQVLRNLLSNAFKFTKQGQVSVCFRGPRGAEIDAGNYVLAIDVTDTGIGIPHNKREAIFKAFQQVDGGVSREFGGTGLGLSISRELMRLLGGGIQVESTLGEGSCFTLTLPARMPESPGATGDDADAMGERSRDDLRPLMARPTDSPRPTAQATARRIVIVEDDPSFADVLAGIARSRGFEAVVATDGEAGLKAIRREQPCGVILDIKLPGMSGWDLMRDLQADPKLRSIPAHVISATRDDTEARASNAVSVLQKPVSTEDLEAVFDRIVQVAGPAPSRILVVEDRRDLRLSISRTLEAQGLEVVAVGSGEAAWNRLQTERFDGMTLDLGLPDISGFEFLERMQNLPLSARLPVIVFTAAELDHEQIRRLQPYTESIIVKDVASLERLVDETHLFLHRVDSGASDSRPAATAPGLDESDTDLLGKTVLIVDDDMRSSFAIANLLTSHGMVVHLAEHGQRALDLLEEHGDIQIVLMDIMMPVLDGYDAMTRIRQMDRHADLPIIALTAKAMAGDRERAMNAGANDYLTKPVDTGRLLSLLRVWLHA